MTKFNSILLLSVSAMCGNCAYALDINITEPGSLSSLISDTSASSLIVKGNINAKDLFDIANNFSSLSVLDLSEASIQACSINQPEGKVDYDANLIPSAVFAGSSLSSVVFPAEGSIVIGDLAFSATKLTSLSLPANVTAIGQGAFAACNSLESVSVPASTSLDGYVFSNCTALKSADLNGAAAIAVAEFANCSNLTSLENIYAVSDISDYAFKGCSALSEYSFNSIINIGNGAFYGSGIQIADFTAATSLSAIGECAFADCTSLTSVSFDPEAEITINKGAFFGCTAITDLQLPKVSTLSDFVLTDVSSVSSVDLPSSLSYIGENAMAGMTSLFSINASELSSVPELGDDVWRNVDQSSVYLLTSDDVTNDFKAAEQWQEFCFGRIPTDAVSITQDTFDVKARFDGSDLQIKASGCTIAHVALYDPAGLMLTALDVADTDYLSVSTSDFQTRIYIVTVTLSNGKTATTKLIRK